MANSQRWSCVRARTALELSCQTTPENPQVVRLRAWAKRLRRFKRSKTGFNQSPAWWVVASGPPVARPLRADAVAHAAHGLDALSADLAAKCPDVDVDDVGAGVEVVSPHVGEDLLPGQHLPGVP